MKAMVYTEYGSADVLRYGDVVKPTPDENEVLVRVHAASVNTADWYMLTGKPFMVRLMAGGLSKPKNTILGSDIAGQVEAVGKAVTTFKPGDAVFGDLSACGLGGFAEYVAVPAEVLAIKPPNLTFEQAAAVPLAAVTALQALRDKGGVQAGQTVLINGASGGVGTFAVQLAKAFGAHVTAVCSTRNVAQVRAIGADQVIDYKQEDFTKSGQQVDLIIAVNGYHTLSDYKRALKPGGVYVAAGGKMAQIFESLLLGAWHSMVSGGGKKIKSVTAKPNRDDLAFIGDLLAAGKIMPVIDRCYLFSEAIEALRYLGEGHAQGKVVISMGASPTTG